MVALTFAALAASCQTLEFYRQAVVGQLDVHERRRSTAELTEGTATDPALRARLVEAAAILQFARTRLSLNPKKNYSSYVRLDGPYVVWNVFAASEFSTRPRQWCYPIVG
ncbi:MAG: aminopeptidase, partial [Gammaproteobacteria bacterium]